MQSKLYHLQLPCGRIAIIDREDLSLVENYNWFSAPRSNTVYVRGYLIGGDARKRKYLHNLLMGGRADHKNGDGLFNSRENLRRCTQAQNGLNRAPKHARRFKGVQCSRGMFYAELYYNRKRYVSRGHTTMESAARAYDELAKQHHGQFAYLNFPE